MVLHFPHKATTMSISIVQSFLHFFPAAITSLGFLWNNLTRQVKGDESVSISSIIPTVIVLSSVICPLFLSATILLVCHALYKNWVLFIIVCKVPVLFSTIV